MGMVIACSRIKGRHEKGTGDECGAPERAKRFICNGLLHAHRLSTSEGHRGFRGRVRHFAEVDSKVALDELPGGRGQSRDSWFFVQLRSLTSAVQAAKALQPKLFHSGRGLPLEGGGDIASDFRNVSLLAGCNVRHTSVVECER